MPPVRHAGFAMLDVLVALLLLAVALAGASVTLIQSMRATHGALLGMHAADLAADLAEELRNVNSVTLRDSTMTAWRDRAVTLLPARGLDPDQFATLRASTAAGRTTAEYELHLRWHDAPRGAVRELRVPVLAPFLVQP